MKTKPKNISKEDFLTVMKSMSAKQMQEYIESKGKEPKYYNPMMHAKG